MVQQLANASKDVDASINDLNRHAARAQKVVRNFFCNKTVAVAERLQTFFDWNAAILPSSVDEMAHNLVTFLQSDLVHFQATVQERLEQLVGQGGARGQNGPHCSQCGLSAQVDPQSGSVDLDSGS